MVLKQIIIVTVFIFSHVIALQKDNLPVAKDLIKENKSDSAKVQIKILEYKYKDNKELGRFYNSLGYYYLNYCCPK